MKTQLIICLDGCSPEYITAADTPNLDAIARQGFHAVGRAALPTVTNVNNTTIITAHRPAVHGITCNYYRDRTDGSEFYMESAEFVLAPTLFQRLAARGRSTALLTAKNKLKTLIQAGAGMAESAEDPPSWLVDRIGPPPHVYSIEVNHWLFRAAREVMRRKAPDFLYVTTTDYVNHKHAPEDERSRWNVSRLDELLGEIMNAGSDVELVLTADHGMNAKSRALDLNLILKAAGIGGHAIPIIKDRYVVHHKNMGGAAYVYLDQAEEMADAIGLLEAQAGIEQVLTAPQAARTCHLHPGRIGDLFVLADEATVFGALPAPAEAVDIRSHGSRHEQRIPIYAYGPGPVALKPMANHEVGAWVDP